MSKIQFMSLEIVLCLVLIYAVISFIRYYKKHKIIDYEIKKNNMIYVNSRIIDYCQKNRIKANSQDVIYDFMMNHKTMKYKNVAHTTIINMNMHLLKKLL